MHIFTYTTASGDEKTISESKARELIEIHFGVLPYECVMLSLIEIQNYLDQIFTTCLSKEEIKEPQKSCSQSLLHGSNSTPTGYTISRGSVSWAVSMS